MASSRYKPADLDLEGAKFLLQRAFTHLPVLDRINHALAVIYPDWRWRSAQPLHYRHVGGYTERIPISHVRCKNH